MRGFGEDGIGPGGSLRCNNFRGCQVFEGYTEGDTTSIRCQGGDIRGSDRVLSSWDGC